ncbi:MULTISPECIES: DUF1631 domain-containing protein [unclassified Ketobacter]|uniref:DUF1631 domain-containing protein n=1 Tax=unclassified Ketobacter TaxID=2639109 RepID=UPI0025C24096|nr:MULTISPECIES: DUF1631 domain-containing protein [unclassified Ketobacter]MEC8813274.1 DUF1631 domain-containing protein [Pseudomonadota bacterium]
MHNAHNRDRDGSLLVNIQSRVLASLSDLLTEFFHQMDDAFFDRAEQAATNNEQNMYFEAMRELRMHARDVDNELRKELAFQFDLLSKKQRQEDVHRDDDLSLVDKDRVEVDVALSNIRNKIRTSYPDLQLQFSRLLNHYLGIDWLNEDNHPLGADTLVTAFSHAIEKLDLPLKVRLMVLKYFERQVVENLRQPLLDAAKILLDAGVKSEPANTSTTSTPPAGPEQQAAPGASAAEPQPAASQGGDSPDLHSALAAHYETTVPFEQVQALMTHFYKGSLNNRLFAVKQGQAAPELHREDLFSVLSRLQSAERDSLQDEDPANSHYDHQDVRLLLEHQLAHTVRQRGARKLKQADDDVINLVSMVFEFILDDHNIPPEVSLLLGRLQIPVIKIALADKQFFSDAHHPARRLLKLLSQAAIGWEKESVLQRDLLMEEIRNVVTRILNEFEVDNLSLFADLEKSFSRFLQEETRRAKTVEKRVLQTAQGQAKTEQARNTINQLINDRMQGKTLPSVVIDMIDGPWRVLMLQRLMRHGRDSDEWKHCLKTVDDLIWSIQPANAGSDRERWVKIIPTLLREICGGLESIKHPGLEVDKFLAALWEIHGQILQTPPDQQLPNSRTVDHTLTEPAGSPVAVHHTPGNSPASDPASGAELSAIERQKKRAAERKALLDPKQHAQSDLRRQLLTMKAGQWIEVHTLEGKVRRCKLAWRDTNTDIYIFVSRRGNKVLETNLDSMIRMANADELRLLENVSMWDRALSNVLGGLKRNVSREAETSSTD